MRFVVKAEMQRRRYTVMSNGGASFDCDSNYRIV